MNAPIRKLTNSFSSYQLTEDQQRVGAQLTPENIYVIQNHISDLAEEKLNLIFTPNEPMAFALRNAELQGQIDILKMLVEVSASAYLQQSHLDQE